jgi:hypothetical protein
MNYPELLKDYVNNFLRLHIEEEYEDDDIDSEKVVAIVKQYFKTNTFTNFHTSTLLGKPLSNYDAITAVDILYMINYILSEMEEEEHLNYGLAHIVDKYAIACAMKCVYDYKYNDDILDKDSI